MTDEPNPPRPPEADPPADHDPATPTDPPPPPGPAAEEPPTGLRCAECHFPLEEDQTYCLNCGAPTPLAPRLRRRNGAGVLAAGLAALGIGAGVLGVAVANDQDGDQLGTIVSTARTDVVTVAPVTTGALPPDTVYVTPSTPETVSTDPEPPATETTYITTTSGGDIPPPDTTPSVDDPAPTPSDPSTDTTVDDPGGGLPPDTGSAVDPESEWPHGTSAWTAVLASARDGDAARRQRSRARSAGYGAHILNSDDHPNLTPGYWVVYVGEFRNRSDARGLAIRARQDFPGAYPRYVSS